MGKKQKFLGAALFKKDGVLRSFLQKSFTKNFYDFRGLSVMSFRMASGHASAGFVPFDDR
ncbi:hypothetical protein [Novacetimonas pomaceti]|uniref:hypothetical protein n=1 Tax=Novacetimonas pomaceti TaxID=2021998 RepID=UPI0010579620|nr:hypothetical protein [Novacetimonas pomaceti]